MYPKIKRKKQKIKINIINNIKNFIINFKNIEYFVLFMKKSFHF